MNSPIPSWLYFSRQERRASLILLFITLVNLIIRYWILPYYKKLPEPNWQQITLVNQGNSQTAEIIQGYLYDTTITNKKNAMPQVVIEINEADSANLEHLPMIGGFLAQRIVDYREALGGYYSLDQLLEIKYLKEDVWENLRSKWKCNGKVKKLLINHCNMEELAAHPYLQYSQAKRIINYRMQHGPFLRIEQLKLVKAIPDSMWYRILPYLAVDSISP